MLVYKDVLELSRIHEIIDKFHDYPVFKSGKLMADESFIFQQSDKLFKIYRT